MGFSFVIFHGDRGLIIFSVRKRCTANFYHFPCQAQGARALMVMVMLFNHGREEEPLSSREVNATSQPTMVPSLTSPVFNGFYPLPGCSSFFTHDYWPTT